jgi:hypothetical protein
VVDFRPKNNINSFFSVNMFQISTCKVQVASRLSETITTTTTTTTTTTVAN